MYVYEDKYTAINEILWNKNILNLSKKSYVL